jgi:hypothetical protein
MLDLERAHDHLRRSTRLIEGHAQAGASGALDLRPAARALERAFEALFDAFDERRPRFEATRASLSALEDASAELAPAAASDPAIGFALEELRDARSALLEAGERLAPLVPRIPPPAPDLRASENVPALHAVDRASLTPGVRVPDPAPPEVSATPPALERPKTFEALAAAVKTLKERAGARSAPASDPTAALPGTETRPAVPPEPPFGFAEDVGRVESEEQFVRARVRDCFEEVAMIGVQRAPLLGDPWRTAQILERRMLAAIDAIVAMGPPALRALEPLTFDAPLKDPARVFALSMVLGCVHGRDALAIAERVFFALEPSDPAHAPHFAAALKLVPHADVPLALRTWLAGDEAHRALAIDVLAYREMATDEEIARAAVDEPAVAAVALPWLGLRRGPTLPEALDRGLASDDVRLRIAARRAMMLSGDRRTGPALRTALSLDGVEGETAASWLGLVAGANDAAALLERALATPSRALVTAVGWAGSPAAVPALIGLLGSGDEAVVLAAAYALDRLTHAGLYEEAIVDADEIQAPDVPEPAVDLDDGEAPRPPLARLVSDPRDLPAQPATETLRRPTIDAARWQAYWRERGPSFHQALRYRRGTPYTPLVSWRELDLFPCTPGERRLLHDELVARTGEPHRFDPHDFVPVQEASIKAWEEPARRASGQPGNWLLPLRR